jgi:beta-glucosidase
MLSIPLFKEILFCKVVLSLSFVMMLSQSTMAQDMTEFKPFKPPINYAEAFKKADSILAKLSIEQKVDLIGGHNFFFVQGYPDLGIPELYLSDATAGVHIRKQLSNQLEKSVAFPAPINLAATWNPDLAQEVARSIGEECRAGGIAVLLGPGMNIYRISQCGRNFEYFGEDPYLAARMIEHFVVGVQSTGTIATLKHFLCNNTDYMRRRSNSIVDERALHEIYLPAFKAGIDAGAMAVMTSYNQLNGEWCGQNPYVINQLLRKDLEFKWLVMTDWWSTYDPEKIIKSGQDLDMPGEPGGDANFQKLGDVYLRTNAARLLKERKVSGEDIDRMAEKILTTEIAMDLLNRPVKDESYLKNFSHHEEIALQDAREGIVLLRNENNVLPIAKDFSKKILVTGEFLEKLPQGGGSAAVEGYDNLLMLVALRNEFGNQMEYAENPSEDQIKSADVVLVSIGTHDSEGHDRPFDLPKGTDDEIIHYAGLNPGVVVVVNSGGGVRMTNWNDKVAGIIYAWYPGQIGNKALAEVISGKTNPSGKLPITIEKEFADSPGSSYIPNGGQPHDAMRNDLDYRWYESKEIEPLYYFGFGLSYTKFEISNLTVSKDIFKQGDSLSIEITVKNTGKMAGAEVVQLYINPLNTPVPRPDKELKGFKKVYLNPGESKKVVMTLTDKDFSYWDISRHAWNAAPGEFNILVGAASNDIRETAKVSLED